MEDLRDEDQIFVRNAEFRRNVVKLHDQRCAFCKVRVVSWDGVNKVDGAHVQPFAEFWSDSLVNGLALRKTPLGHLSMDDFGAMTIAEF